MSVNARSAEPGPRSVSRHEDLKVFIAHGRDPDAKDEIMKWLRRLKSPTVEPVDLGPALAAGEALFTTWERVAAEADAAIFLATPDDIGRLVTSKTDSLRARQNLWIELGWFWGRLGRQRTWLISKGDIEIPSDYSGIVYLSYTANPAEVFPSLRKRLHSLRRLAPDSLTEVTYVSSNPLSREQEWEEIHQDATASLIITGISMGKVRHRLPSLFEMMLRDKPKLRLHLIVVHPHFAYEHHSLFTNEHGVHAVRDNHTFFPDLVRNLRRYPDVIDRVRLFLYRGFPTFAAVVADGPAWGSTMLAQTFLPRARDTFFDYPRTKLRHRTEQGLYLSFWNAISDLLHRCSADGLASLAEIEELEATINALPPLS